MNISNNETELQNKNCTVLGECACEECCDCSFEDCFSEEWIDCNEDGCNDPCEECCSKNDCNAEWTSEDQGCDECICEECESCDDEWCDTTCEEACVGSCPESACEDCCEDEWGVITPEEPSSENACEECCEDEWLNETPGFPVEECPEDDFNEACPIEECCNDPWMNEDTSCDEPVEQECCPNNETVENTSGNQDPDASEENGWVNDNTYSWYDECAANCPGWVRVTGVKASVKRVSIAIGETYQLKATIYPCNASCKDVTWVCYDNSTEKVVSLKPMRGTVTGLREGSVRLTVISDDGEFTDTCVVDVGEKELVTVEKDDNVTTAVGDDKGYFTVTFENGKVWKNIGCDLDLKENRTGVYLWEINDEDLSFQHERNYKYNVQQTYSNEQLALLYRLDPLGVVQYVKYHASAKDDLAKGLRYKDDVYCAIFGDQDKKQNRFYFLPRDDGSLAFGSYERCDRTKVYSRAELVFGKHTIIEIDKIEFWMTFVKEIFCFISPMFEAVFTGIEICQALFFSEAIVGPGTNVAQKYLKNYAEENPKSMVAKMYGWMKVLLLAVSISDNLNGMVDILTVKDADIYKCIQATNYSVIIKKGSTQYYMNEIVALYD